MSAADQQQVDSLSASSKQRNLALENKWANRSKKWLIEDDSDQEIQHWKEADLAQIKKLEGELSTTMEMYTTAAADAEYKNNSWGHVQLVLGFIATTLSFINASALPSMIADGDDQKTFHVVSVLSVIIGVVTILTTAIAERLKKKDYAVKASNLERVHVDYRGVFDLLKSEMAFPKRRAIVLEAKIRRIIQELTAGHINHQPPPEIKEMYGMIRIHRDRGACSKFYRWIKSWCFDDDPLDKPKHEISSRASMAKREVLERAIDKEKMKKSLKKHGVRPSQIEIAVDDAEKKWSEIAIEEKNKAKKQEEEDDEYEAARREESKKEAALRKSGVEQAAQQKAADLQRERVAEKEEAEKKEAELQAKLDAVDKQLKDAQRKVEDFEAKKKAADEAEAKQKEEKRMEQIKLVARLEATLEMAKIEAAKETKESVTATSDVQQTEDELKAAQDVLDKLSVEEVDLEEVGTEQ